MILAVFFLGGGLAAKFVSEIKSPTNINLEIDNSKVQLATVESDKLYVDSTLDGASAYGSTGLQATVSNKDYKYKFYEVDKDGKEVTDHHLSYNPDLQTSNEITVTAVKGGNTYMQVDLYDMRDTKITSSEKIPIQIDDFSYAFSSNQSFFSNEAVATVKNYVAPSQDAATIAPSVSYGKDEETKTYNIKTVGVNNSPVMSTANHVSSIVFAEHSNVTTISDNAFKETETDHYLTSIDISNAEGITALGHTIFENCTLLSKDSLHLPGRIDTIEADTFSNSAFLGQDQDVYFDADNQYVLGSKQDGFTQQVLKMKNVITVAKSAVTNHDSLKKIVVRNDNSIIAHINDGAFANNSHLENFVVATEGVNDKTVYGENVLDNCGTDDPKQAAPLVVAGGSATQAKFSSNYSYKSLEFIGGVQSNTKSLSENKYYYLNDNLEASDSFPAAPLISVTASDCVLDLATHNVDRKLGSEEVVNGAAIYVDNKDGERKFRLDESNTMLKDDMGKVTGGFNKNSSNREDEQGHKLHLGSGLSLGRDSYEHYLEASFVNGRITGNKGHHEGAGIDLRRNAKFLDAPFNTLKLYGGYIDSNTLETKDREADKMWGGAGIKLQNCNNLIIYNGHIIDNSASGENAKGAGFFIDNGTKNDYDLAPTAYIYGGTIKDNFLDGDKNAGGISIADSDTGPAKLYANVSVKNNIVLENTGVQGFPLYTFNSDNTVSITDSISVGNYIARVADKIDGKNLTTINSLNSDTNLKKFVIDNPDHQVTVKSGAFNGCECLETFICKATSDDSNMNYESGAFNGAGTTDGMKAAPLILAGQNNTKGAASSSIKAYTYREIAHSGSQGQALTLDDGVYYYMTGNYKLDSRVSQVEGADSVIDTNGRVLDRGLGEATESLDGGQVIFADKECTLRVDDSASFAQKLTGKITGGFVKNNSGKKDNVGGGMLVNGTLNFVNGNVCDNRADTESPGVGINAPYNSGAGVCAFNMYGGYITNNTQENLTSSDPTWSGGGVLIRNGGTFNMYDGTISKNIVPDGGTGAGVSVYNGGITPDKTLYKTKANLYQGKIFDNKVGEEDKGQVTVRLYPEEMELYEMFALDKCDFTMHNLGIPRYSIENGQAYLKDNVHSSGDTPFSKDYCVHVPGSIDVPSGTYNVAGISESAFKDDPYIKKVVVENPNSVSSFTVGENAFNGAQNLENFVVRANSTDDNLSYGSNSFYNAGNRETETSPAEGRAALIMAGGDVTKDAAKNSSICGHTSSVNLPLAYDYYPISEITNNKLPDVDKSYFYLTQNCTVTQTVHYGNTETENGIDCVLDLNGYDLGYADKSTTLIENTRVLEIDGTKEDKTKQNSLRLDDTCCVQHVLSNTRYSGSEYYGAYPGNIKYGHCADRNGGGIRDTGILKFVNGCVFDNIAHQSGGIAVTGTDTVNGLQHGNLYMYNGVIGYNTAQNNNPGSSNPSPIGGGVNVKGGGLFKMYDGHIVGNNCINNNADGNANGGGVFVWSDQNGKGEFYMYGGVIGARKATDTSYMNNVGNSNNNSHGSGVCVGGSTSTTIGPVENAYFEMLGGKIMFNKLKNVYSGTQYGGLGKYSDKSQFVFSLAVQEGRDYVWDKSS